MENGEKRTARIENCCDCGYSHRERLYTPDSFEHEEGLYCTKCVSKDGMSRLICSDDKDLRKYAKVPEWCPLADSPVNRVKKDLEEICREQNGVSGTVNSNSVKPNSVNPNFGNGGFNPNMNNPRGKSSFEEFIEKGAKAVENGVNKVVSTISESLGNSQNNNQNTWGNPANNNPIYVYGVADAMGRKSASKKPYKPEISENELWNIFREHGMSAIKDFVEGAYELGKKHGEEGSSVDMSQELSKEYNRGFADGLKAGGFYNPNNTPVVPESPAPYEPAKEIPVEVYGVFNGERPFNPAEHTPIKVYGVPENMRKRTTPNSPDMAGEVTLAYGVFFDNNSGVSPDAIDSITTVSSDNSGGVSLGKGVDGMPRKNTKPNHNPNHNSNKKSGK